MNASIEYSKQFVVRNYQDLFPQNIPHEGFSSENESFLNHESSNSKANEISIKRFKSNDDFGHIIKKENRGTFFPSTIDEISQIVTYAQNEKIALSCREGDILLMDKLKSNKGSSWI